MGAEDLELEDEEQEQQDLIKSDLFSSFIRMWPRSIFHKIAEEETEPHPNGSSIAKNIQALKKPGVYILYRDDQPFYVGQTSGELCKRLETHALKLSRRSYFWNYFSAFIVENSEHRIQLESLLIATMPSVLSNGAVPRLTKEKMPGPVRDLFKKSRWEGQY